ncbi:hypothetical protein PZC41_14315 [Staphylococcus aureus]|uniref:hypothetical protein n=1 Tax=Staphylococcus aureus TaxID=1280 RepID=UPI0023B1A8CF|nr:hypothetical protein [Staphylococcus aureus]MDE8535478.1 hypothetical protein [Staphylococcus aureus]
MNEQQTTTKKYRQTPKYDTFVKAPAKQYALAMAITYGSVCALIVIVAYVWSYLLFVWYGRDFGDYPRSIIMASLGAVLLFYIAIYYGTLSAQIRHRTAVLDDITQRPAEEFEVTVKPGEVQLRPLDEVIPGNGRPNARIPQPEPGAFPRWLREVLEPSNRVQFSQNEARRRGYTESDFIMLQSELKRVGWLQANPDRNGVHRMTSDGERRAREWLSK